MSHTRKNHRINRAPYFSESARREDRKRVDEIAAAWNAEQANIAKGESGSLKAEKVKGRTI